MILVGEVQEFAGDTLFLQNVEERQALRDGQSEVQVVVHHKVGCGPFVDVVDRIEFLIILSVRPQRTVQLFHRQSYPPNAMVEHSRRAA